MPQRVTIVYICSLCAAETDDKRKMTPYQLSTGNSTWALDICPACEDGDSAFAQVLRVGLKDRAPRNGAEAPPVQQTLDGAWVCPECGEVLPSERGVSQHRRAMHGWVSPHAAEMAARGTGPLPCPVKGCGFGAKANQGLVAHLKAKHADLSPAALAAARARAGLSAR